MKLPAGTYFIGDPCYCFDDHDKWMKLLDHCDFFSGCEVFMFEGKAMFGAGTMYGDGCYLDQDFNEYSVDAGLIGATPVEFLGSKYSRAEMERLGQFVTFAEDVDAYEDDGDIVIGHIRIVTGDEDLGDTY